MSYRSIYFSPGRDQFLLDLLKIVLVVAGPVCEVGLWWSRLAVDRTPPPEHTTTTRTQRPSMGHKESKERKGAAGLSSEDITFLVKNTNRTKKEIKVRPSSR